MIVSRPPKTQVSVSVSSQNGAILLLLLWPILAGFLCMALWYKTLHGIEDDQRALASAGLQNAATLARGYAQFVTRTLEQMDQVTMHVKYDWEASSAPPRLEQMVQHGLFTASQFSRIALANRDGLVISTSSVASGPLSISESEYFGFHKNNNSTAMHISVLPAALGEMPTIVFSRRLDTGDDNFDGVVAIAVEADHLLAFDDPLSFGQHGLIGVAALDGMLRLTRIGRDGPVHSDLPTVNGETGTRLLPAAAFADHSARYVGWQALGSYPFLVLAGISDDDLMHPHRESWSAYRHFAWAGTLLLVLFAAVAMLLSARLRYRAREQAELSATYRNATEGGNDGFYLLKPVRNGRRTIVDFLILDCNQRAAAFYGVEKDALVGKKFSDQYSSAYFPEVLVTLVEAMRIGHYEDHFEVPRASPVRMRWVIRKLVRTGDHLALTLQDISAAKQHQVELDLVASRDELTGLPHRGWLMLTLQEALKDQRGLAVLVVGLDSFKRVNEAFGLLTGNELLRMAAQRLGAMLRPSDHVVRLGGDEFALILAGLTLDEDGDILASRVKEALSQPFSLSATTLTLTASTGLAIAPRDGADAETLVKNADIAMHAAKSAGKNRHHRYDPQLAAVIQRRFETELALRQAIAQDEFVLAFQPRVDTWSGEMRSMEALVRWHRPGFGLVSPLDFIPLAEETGLILPLGELIMEKAFRQIAQWQSEQLTVLPVSVNVSARQFHEGHVEQLLAGLFARYQLAPNLIEIELTESATMGESSDTIAELSSIRALGVKLFIDDFGTGYSSLSQLQRLKMDALKVDRNFTAELCRTSEGEVFFRAIVSMAHALGMSVVAEGVETLEELRVLQQLGCDETQGYLVARPLPAEQIARLLSQRFLFTPGSNMASRR